MTSDPHAPTRPAFERDQWDIDRPTPAGSAVRSPGRGVVVGLAAVVLALAAKGVLNAIGGQDVSYLPLFVAVAVASMSGGFGAGVIVIVAGAVLDAVLFQSVGGSLFAARPAALVRFVLFIPAAALIAWLVAAGRTEREAARTAAERFRQLLDDSPDFIILVDLDTWTIEYANAACASFGWPVGHLTGRSGDLVIPELRDLAVAPLDELAGRAMTVLSETGEPRPVEVLARPMERGMTGRPLLFVSARDMTERIDSATRLMRLARVERARAAELRAVIDSMDDAVAVFGPGGEVVLANAGMTRLTGGGIATRAELDAILGAPSVDADRDSVSRAEVHLGSPERWLELRQFPVRSDDADQAAEASSLVVLRDTTVERVAQETRETFLGILSH